MKKFLVCAVAVLAIIAVTVPASALEVKYGGLFRARVLSQSDFPGYGPPGFSTSEANSLGHPELLTGGFDHNNRLDQRLRIFMYFVASENLRVVTKFEANTVWGDWGISDPSDIVGGGNVGADVNNFGIKNAYVDFMIPGTPLRGMVGVQGIALIDSWVVDDDFSAALLQAKLDPVTVTIGYVSGQNFSTTTETENIDDAVLAVDYAGGPFRASLVGFYQNAHNTTASMFPQTIASPMHGYFAGLTENQVLGRKDFFFPGGSIRDEDGNVIGTVPANGFVFNTGSSGIGNFSVFPWDTDYIMTVENNQLFDLAFSLGYKMDFLSAYVNFVKNFGTVDRLAIFEPSEVTAGRAVPGGELNDIDYTGWMVDGGLTYFCGPWTFNIGGFYTSGQELAVDGLEVFPQDPKEIQWFTYPLATTKYFSEIMGGGILDNTAPNGGYWSGYPQPTNLWTATVGGAWQVLPGTKLSASYWYFGTAEDVPAGLNREETTWKMDNALGHEFDFYVTQQVVDKLMLDLVGAYMITDDAFSIRHARGGSLEGKDDDVYELGARLQWSF